MPRPAQGQRCLTPSSRTAKLLALRPIITRTPPPSVITARLSSSRAPAGAGHPPLVFAPDSRLSSDLHHHSLQQHGEPHAQCGEPLSGVSTFGIVGAAWFGGFFSGAAIYCLRSFWRGSGRHAQSQEIDRDHAFTQRAAWSGARILT